MTDWSEFKPGPSSGPAHVARSLEPALHLTGHEPPTACNFNLDTSYNMASASAVRGARRTCGESEISA